MRSHRAVATKKENQWEPTLSRTCEPGSVNRPAIKTRPCERPVAEPLFFIVRPRSLVCHIPAKAIHTGLAGQRLVRDHARLAQIHVFFNFIFAFIAG